MSACEREGGERDSPGHLAIDMFSGRFVLGQNLYGNRGHGTSFSLKHRCPHILCKAFACSWAQVLWSKDCCSLHTFCRKFSASDSVSFILSTFSTFKFKGRPFTQAPRKGRGLGKLPPVSVNSTTMAYNFCVRFFKDTEPI